ncbi:MAG: hypothetical protein OXQ29_24585, partial [Rhodospirillaceae bacterium]|nr:hypothetical protein [Rhodospirillaceae bacterium]
MAEPTLTLFDFGRGIRVLETRTSRGLAKMLTGYRREAIHQYQDQEEEPTRLPTPAIAEDTP